MTCSKLRTSSYTYLLAKLSTVPTTIVATFSQTGCRTSHPKTLSPSIVHTRGVNGSDRIGFCLYHIFYRIFLSDSDRIMNGCGFGSGYMWSRIQNGNGADQDGNKINRTGTLTVHNQATKLKIITLQLNNLTKLYSLVFTMTIEVSFYSTDELHYSLITNFALLV